VEKETYPKIIERILKDSSAFQRILSSSLYTHIYIIDAKTLNPIPTLQEDIIPHSKIQKIELQIVNVICRMRASVSKMGN
jgi:hypothetical protein